MSGMFFKYIDPDLESGNFIIFDPSNKLFTRLVSSKLSDLMLSFRFVNWYVVCDKFLVWVGTLETDWDVWFGSGGARPISDTVSDDSVVGEGWSIPFKAWNVFCRLGASSLFDEVSEARELWLGSNELCKPSEALCKGVLCDVL
jgi:hypothetical protein